MVHGYGDRASLALPEGFLIGTATAAAQIEGGTTAGARSPSVWDAFSAEPGRILDGSDTSVTTDHYHRYADDVALMTALGVDAYRLSLSWTRLQPHGTGPLDPGGADFYDRLLDALLAAGIAPFVTISHWDLPKAYTRGWLDRDTALQFGDLAALVGEHFGDRVHTWLTLNEPATVTLNGYALGVHAPGQTLLFDALPTVHHQLLAHGLGVQALRASGVTGQIGITNVHSPVLPASDSAEDQLMAHLFDLVHNRVFTDPVLLGRYPEPPEELSDHFGAFTGIPAEDLSVISQPLDCYGLNYYMPSLVAAGAGDGSTPDGTSAAMAAVPFQLLDLDGYPRTGFGWPVAPEYLQVSLFELVERYGDRLPPVYITESGASFPDAPGADGTIEDRNRIDYLSGHLEAAITATAPGGAAEQVDLRGYFVWSLLDNWEWAAGFTQRFGLVHVDFDTLARTPKESYRWLQRLLAVRRRR